MCDLSILDCIVFFKILIYLFISFWLHRILVAAVGSFVATRGLWVVVGGLQGAWALYLRHTGSLVVVCRLSSCSIWA